MINLLPGEKKVEIRAARANVILVRYIIIILLAFAFILGAMYITHVSLASTKASSEEIIASNDLQAKVYSATQSQASALSASLAETKTVLSQEIRYSVVLTNIGKIMPPRTILEMLTLGSDPSGSMQISTKAYAKSLADATALQTAFQQSSIFSSVRFQPFSESGGVLSGYPVSAEVTLTLNRTVGQ